MRFGVSVKMTLNVTKPVCERPLNRRYKTFVSTLHCTLENGAGLYKRASRDTTLSR